jgi:hypothetical protein
MSSTSQGTMTSQRLLSNIGPFEKKHRQAHIHAKRLYPVRVNTRRVSFTFSSSRRPPRPESFRPPVQRLGRNREPWCKPRSCLRLPTALVSQRLFGALCSS